MLSKRIVLGVVFFTCGFTNVSFAQNWGQVPFVSSTMGINSGRLCIGEGARGDIGCPTYAPTINSAGLLTAGNISSTGNISANFFLGDGSLLTGLPSTATDRISSTNNQAMVVATTGGTISFTLGGTAGAAYLHPTLGLVVSGVSTTGVVSVVSIYLPGTSANNQGVIYKDGMRFLHDFKHPTGGGAIPQGRNVFLGRSAGNFSMGSTATTTGQASNNVGVGDETLRYNTTGYGNTAIGAVSLVNNTSGFNNTASGGFTLISNTTGRDNTTIGFASLYNTITGSYNSVYGSHSFSDNLSGGGNTVLGYNAGRGVTTGSQNTIIGANVTGLASDLNNTVIIADGAGNRRIYVHNDGDVGLGTTSPTTQLHISGTLRLANGGEACDANRAGGIRYNSGVFEFCAGSSWQSLAAVASAGGLATNRISTTGVASGATLAAVQADMGTVSFTLGGTEGAAYLHPTLGLVAAGVSTTGGISGTTGYFADNVTVSGSVKVGGAADGDCDNTKNGTFRIDPATGRLQMCRL